MTFMSCVRNEYRAAVPIARIATRNSPDVALEVRVASVERDARRARACRVDKPLKILSAEKTVRSPEVQTFEQEPCREFERSGRTDRSLNGIKPPGRGRRVCGSVVVHSRDGRLLTLTGASAAGRDRGRGRLPPGDTWRRILRA